jgi:hypothetical protein
VPGRSSAGDVRINGIHPCWAVWAMLTPCGLILCVSYIRDNRISLRDGMGMLFTIN